MTHDIASDILTCGDQVHLPGVHRPGAALHSGDVSQHHGCVQSLRRQQAAHRQPLPRPHRGGLHLMVSAQYYDNRQRIQILGSLWSIC